MWPSMSWPCTSCSSTLLPAPKHHLECPVCKGTLTHHAPWGKMSSNWFYGDEEPAPRFLERMPLLLAHHIPVRSTSKLLKGSIYDPSCRQHSQGMKQHASTPAPANAPMVPTPLAQVAGSTSQQQGESSFASSMQAWQQRTQQVFQKQESTATVTPLPLQDQQPTAGAAATGVPSAMAPSQAQPMPGNASKPAEPQQTSSLEVQSTQVEKAKKESQGLDHWTQLAFDKLQAKKRKGAPLKRPAASKPSSCKAPASSSKTNATCKKGKGFGCGRCYGNPNGCSTCRNPNFQGVRLCGAKAYKDHKMSKKA